MMRWTWIRPITILLLEPIALSDEISIRRDSPFEAFTITLKTRDGVDETLFIAVDEKKCFGC